MSKRKRQPGIPDNIDDTENSLQGLTKPKNLIRPQQNLKSTATSRRTLPKSKLASAAAKKERNKFICAIDYGTTYSGIAYVSKNGSDTRDIEVVTDWPRAKLTSERFEKAPSTIAYASENEGFQKDKWGFQVPAGANSYTWTKLFFDEDAALTRFDVKKADDDFSASMLKLPNGKSADEVATDYLRHLHSHTMMQLAKIKGDHVLKVTSVEFWFTVPAIWREPAINRLRDAAMRAGFGSRKGDVLNIIREPEGAALAMISEAIDKNPDLYEVDTNVLIADLGGGTLDFQCLTINSLKPLKTEETIPGNGGKSGASYIDQNLRKWLVGTFGDAFDSLPISMTGPGSKFMDDWETVKKTFDGEDLEQPFPLRLPALGKTLKKKNLAPATYDFGENLVLVPGEDIVKMFLPSLKKAMSILRAQVDTLKKEKKGSLKVVALCGGLGGSEYVWNYFKEHGRKVYGTKVQLITSSRAWSAVVRGAALRGLGGNMVLWKVAKRWYGVGVHQAFREGVDDEEDRYDCPLNGKRAEGYVHWVVNKGKKFTKNFKAESMLYAAVEQDADEKETWDLYSCIADDPPDRVDASGVEYNGEIKLVLSKRWLKRQKIESQEDSTHERADVKIVFKLGADDGTLAVEALYNKRKVGKTTIEYGQRSGRKTGRSAGLL